MPPARDPRSRGADRRLAVLLTAALAGALVLRLAFALGYWTGKPLTHDELEYLHLAASLAEGHGLRYAKDAEKELGTEQYGRAPLYPAFLALVQGKGDRAERLVRIRVAQSVVGTLGVWTLAAIARRAGGGRAGVVAAWLAALYPPLVWLPAYVLTETLYITAAGVTVLALGSVIDGGPAHSGRRPERRQVFLSGVLAGAAVLVRPAMLFFLLLVALWFATRRRPGLVVAVALGALLVVAPWTVRNYRVHDRFVLVASEGGLTFWTGNHPLSPGEGDMAANPAIKLESRRLRALHPGASEESLERVYYREAFRAIAEQPAWWAGLLARKVFYTFVPIGPSYTLHSPAYVAASVIPYGVLLPLGVWGLARARRSGTWPRAQVLLAVSAVLICIVFFPQERFRVPAIDTTLIVGAAAWWGLRPVRPHVSPVV